MQYRLRHSRFSILSVAQRSQCGESVGGKEGEEKERRGEEREGGREGGRMRMKRGRKGGRERVVSIFGSYLM